MTPGRFWAAFLGVGLAVEAFGLSDPERNRWCASPNIRRTLHSHTRPGRAITLALVGGGSTVLASHLINIPAPKESP